MEARKNPKTDAQRDQYLAVCRHTHDNIIFNYGSVENYIVAKNTEINTAESKLQSYYDNPRKGKSRRPAIIAGLENTIFIMKNSLANTLRDLEKLNAATPTETPQISTQTAETVNVSVEGEKGAKIGSNKAVEKAKTWLCPNNTFDIQPYGKNKALYICVDMDTPPRYHVMVAFWEKNSRYEGGKRFTNRQIDMDGKECYFDGSSFPTLQAAREFAARLLSEQPQSPETPQAVECTAGADKLAQTA